MRITKNDYKKMMGQVRLSFFTLIEHAAIELHNANDKTGIPMPPCEVLNYNDSIGYLEKQIEFFFDNPENLSPINSSLGEYTKEFDVVQKELDPYKFMYWSGVVFSAFIRNHTPNAIDVKVADAIPVLALDQVLFKDVGRRLSQEMRDKIYKSIWNGVAEKNFGKYGIYMIFKNCSKQCNYICPLPGVIKKQQDA